MSTVIVAQELLDQLYEDIARLKAEKSKQRCSMCKGIVRDLEGIASMINKGFYSNAQTMLTDLCHVLSKPETVTEQPAEAVLTPPIGGQLLQDSDGNTLIVRDATDPIRVTDCPKCSGRMRTGLPA